MGYLVYDRKIGSFYDRNAVYDSFFNPKMIINLIAHCTWKNNRKVENFTIELNQISCKQNHNYQSHELRRGDYKEKQYFKYR